MDYISTIFDTASSQGIWAVLSIALIFYSLKTQEKRDLRQEARELKYQEIINELSDNFDVVLKIKSDVEDVKARISSNIN